MSQNANSAAVSPNDLALQVVTEAYAPAPDTEKLLALMEDLAALVKNEKDEKRLEPRDQAFAVAEQSFIDRRDVASLIKLLRKKAAWTGDRPAYGAECLSVLSAAATKDRLALAKIESAGFGKAKPSESLRRLSLLLSLGPGSVVAHRTWGYGVVKAEDDYYKTATIEFDDATGGPKALGFAFAAEALVPIGPDHILAKRHADRAAFEESCRKAPGEIVKLALKSWGNLTVSQLQARLEPLLAGIRTEVEVQEIDPETGKKRKARKAVPLDWKIFWEEARRQLARDEAVRLPAAVKKAEAVEMSGEGKRDAASELDKEYKAFAALRDPKEILERAAALAKAGKGLSDAQRAAIADRIGFVFKACVADRKKLGNAAKVRAAMIGLAAGLAEVPVALRPGAEEEFSFVPGAENRSVDLRGTLCRTDIVLDAAASMPAGLMEELAGNLPLAENAAVAAAFVDVLPDMPANLMEHLAPRLLVGAAKGAFAEEVSAELGRPRPSFQLLRWLCHAWARRLEWAKKEGEKARKKAAKAPAPEAEAAKTDAETTKDARKKSAEKAFAEAVAEVVSPFALVSIVAVALAGEAGGEALRMKNDLKKLFVAGRREKAEPKAKDDKASAKEKVAGVEVDEGSKWLKPLMDLMSTEERASVFARLSALDGVWEPLRKRHLLDYLRRTYEGIEELPEEVEEALEAFVRRGITSARSYNERQALLDKLVTVDIPQNTRDIEEAKAHGDLSENFEYQSARDQERVLQARQTQLQKDLAEIAPFDFAQIAQNGLAGVGSFVTVRGADGAEKSYAILGEWDSEPSLGILASGTPLAQALFGAAEGDKVELPGEDGAAAVATVVSVAALPESVLAWARG